MLSLEFITQCVKEVCFFITLNLCCVQEATLSKCLNPFIQGWNFMAKIVVEYMHLVLTCTTLLYTRSVVLEYIRPQSQVFPLVSWRLVLVWHY